MAKTCRREGIKGIRPQSARNERRCTAALCVRPALRVLSSAWSTERGNCRATLAVCEEGAYEDEGRRRGAVKCIVN